MPGCPWLWNVHFNHSVKALLWLCCTSLLRNQHNPSITTVCQDLSNSCVTFKLDLKVLFPFFFPGQMSEDLADSILLVSLWMENHKSRLELIGIHPPGWCNPSTHGADVIRMGMVLFGVVFGF